jgi:hypothetical protein
MAGGNLQVLGSGTPGRLTKWTGITSSNSLIGDTTIFENKNGLVGIGTDTPTSRLTVGGSIQLLSGGITFADGTQETTAFSLNGLTGNVTLAAGTNISITPAGKILTIAAPNALTAVAHDATLTGGGTTATPLGIANGGVGTNQIANGAVISDKLATAAVTNSKIANGAVGANNIASGQVVKSLNGLADHVTLAAGANITITPNGDTLTIASTISTSDPALTAFQKQFDYTMFDGDTGISTDIPIPANKRLVIEYLTLTSSGGDDVWVICELKTHLGSDGDVAYEISPVVVDPNNDDFRFTDKQVRIYADGSVHVRISRIGQTGAMGGRLTISGHLVDLP